MSVNAPVRASGPSIADRQQTHALAALLEREQQRRVGAESNRQGGELCARC